MSIETRSSSALFKRAEQLKRWEDSDTNRESITPKQKPKKVKFSSGCVFLAACAAGDKEEVLRLIEKGADIDTANVDGLTALHQACIDDNLDMVEFLVEHGSDVNRGDNEGWTPLHATASCGFLSIAKYLIEHGANVAAVNNDGELPLDIAECEDMEDLLQTEIDEQGVDCDAARSEEERQMFSDAKEWLADHSNLVDSIHPKTGATALHVAAAKGYVKVMKLLLQCGADVDKQDVDGWTPLHAAAHWGQKESAKILTEQFADMDNKNYVGQTAFDVADTDMFQYLEDLQKNQNKEEVLNRRQAKKRSEISTEPETPTKLKRIEVEIEEKDKNILEIDKKNRVNALTNNEVITNNDDEAVKTSVNSALTIPPKPLADNNSEDNMPSWRRPITRQTKVDPIKTSSFRDRSSASENTTNENEVVLTRTNSFQNDPVNVGKENTIDHTTVSSTPSSVTTSSSNSPTPTSPLPGNQPVRRSFVPPVRDEESETQRKAHAKRVRETRRSTQGVTLEEIKSAEQLVKKKNQTGVNNNNNNTNNNEQFKLEDATKEEESPSTHSFLRKPTPVTNPPLRQVSNAVECAEATITIPLRRPKSQDNKDQDKENDARNAQSTLATQAAIQRRRRPKRRSTGVVAFDNLDDLDSEKDQCAGSEFDDTTKQNHDESGTDRSNRSSRLGSTTDIRGENGEIDYKKLYEQAILENDRLREKLKKSDEELKDTKQTLERLNTVTSKNSLSELEKREKRAMERKLSEMEEELKQLQKLKAENERLRAENRALTRVVSKLTNSANK